MKRKLIILTVCLSTLLIILILVIRIQVWHKQQVADEIALFPGFTYMTLTTLPILYIFTAG